MIKQANGVSGSSVKRAIEERDARALSSFYTDDAVLRIIDRNNTPSRPREIHGKAAISTFWEDVCSRAITHRVDESVTDGDRLVFSQACAYPDGTRVFCLALCELKDKHIARQTVVQAWDE